MKELPKNVKLYKEKIFNNKNVPIFFLSEHSTKNKVWGVLTILKGEIKYTIGKEEYLLNTKKQGIIEPTVIHHIELLGEVEFKIGFYKAV